MDMSDDIVLGSPSRQPIEAYLETAANGGTPSRDWDSMPGVRRLMQTRQPFITDWARSPRSLCRGAIGAVVIHE